MNELTDLHIKVREPEKSIVYPGPRRVGPGDMNLVEKLLGLVQDDARQDLMVEQDGRFWRGRRDEAVDGSWLRMRRMAQEPPSLDKLPSPMPAVIREILMSPQLSRSGLIHIAGGTGCGKTTTASATVVSRLREFGGLAYTVEEPPEMPLNGWHGERGYCTQTRVRGDSEADWVESMRGVLRSQPANTNVMLYVGEIRDAETARAMLRAASNGFLVISTGFGSDLISGIDTFFQLIGKEHAASFAAVLRVIVHQKLEGGRFHVQVLTSEGQSSKVALMIKQGHLSHLQTEIEYQRADMARAQQAQRVAGRS